MQSLRFSSNRAASRPRAGGALRPGGKYAQVEKLLAERHSQRSIVRVSGVSRMTVAKLAKKSAAAQPALAPAAAEKGAAPKMGSA